MSIAFLSFNTTFNTDNFGLEEKFHAQKITSINLLKFIILLWNLITSHFCITSILGILIVNDSFSVFIVALKCEFLSTSSTFREYRACKKSDFNKFLFRVDFFYNLFAKVFKGVAPNEDFSYWSMI